MKNRTSKSKSKKSASATKSGPVRMTARTERPIPFTVVNRDAKPENVTTAPKPLDPHTLADLGLTPGRAWSLHQRAAWAVGTPEQYRKVLFAIHAGIDTGAVRVLHESFGLMVLYVVGNVFIDDGWSDEFIRDVIAVAVDEAGCPSWRDIGWVSAKDARFIDAIEFHADGFDVLNVPMHVELKQDAAE